jgi:hypothetical protein
MCAPSCNCVLQRKVSQDKISCFYMFPALLSKNDVFQAFVTKILTPKKTFINANCTILADFFLHSDTDNDRLALTNNINCKL